jgi:hypothetical protein
MGCRKWACETYRVSIALLEHVKVKGYVTLLPLGSTTFYVSSPRTFTGGLLNNLCVFPDAMTALSEYTTGNDRNQKDSHRSPIDTVL